MSVIGFDEVIQARILSSEKKAIRRIVRRDRDKYFNDSHFFRCAIIKLIKEEKRR